MKKISFIAIILFISVTIGTALAQVDSEYAAALKYYNTGKYEEAAKRFKEYVKKNPKASAYYRIGYALYELGRHKEAYKYFDEAYLIDPEFSPVLVAPGVKEKPEPAKAAGE